MSDWLQVLCGIVIALVVVSGVAWFSIRPPERRGRSYLATRSGNRDEGGKYNEQVLSDSSD